MELRVECPTTFIPGSKVLIVGESPGREELLRGEGFSGPAGRILQRACALAGLDWRCISRTNIVKRSPDGGFDSAHFRSTFYETQETPVVTKTGKVSKKTRRVTVPTTELREWYQVLKDEIVSLHPNVVVAAGTEAARGVAGVCEIHNYRGSVIPATLLPGQKVIPVVHPSYILRGQWSDFWPLVYDLKKVKRESEYPEIRQEPWTELLEPTLGQVTEFLGSIQGRWSFDIETRGGGIACVGVASEGADKRPMALVIPIQCASRAYWSLVDEQAIWQQLHELFARSLLGVGQNVAYDLDWLRDYGVRTNGILMDTMTAHCFLYPEWAQGYKGLDFITSFYLDDVPYYKGEGKTWGSKTPDLNLWHYNTKDAVHTLRASYRIEEQLRARGLWDRYQQEVLPLTYIALEMQERRLPVNESIRRILDVSLQSEISTIHEALLHACGSEINVNSHKQVQQLLYDTLALPTRRRKGTQVITADENALRELRTMYPHPVLDLIIKERHLRKRKESFIDCELEQNG